MSRFFLVSLFFFLGLKGLYTCASDRYEQSQPVRASSMAPKSGYDEEKYLQDWLDRNKSWQDRLDSLKYYLGSRHISQETEILPSEIIESGSLIFEQLPNIATPELMDKALMCLYHLRFWQNNSFDLIKNNILLSRKLEFDSKLLVFCNFCQERKKEDLRKIYNDENLSPIYRLIAHYASVSEESDIEEIRFCLNLIEPVLDSIRVCTNSESHRFLLEALRFTLEVMIGLGEEKYDSFIYILARKIIDIPGHLDIKETAYEHLLKVEPQSRETLLYQILSTSPFNLSFGENETAARLTASGQISEIIAGGGLVIRFADHPSVIYSLCKDSLLDLLNKSNSTNSNKISIWGRLAQGQDQEWREKSINELMEYVLMQPPNDYDDEEFIENREAAAEAILEVLPQDDPRSQIAIRMMIDVANISSPSSPYFIHRILLEKRKEPIKYSPKTYRALTLDIRELSKVRTREKKVKVTREDFHLLRCQLGEEISSVLRSEMQDQIEELKAMLMNQEVTVLVGDKDPQTGNYKGGIVVDPFFTNIFYSLNKGTKELTDTSVFHLAYLINYISQQSDVKDADMVLSSQSKWTLQLLLNVLTCPAGKTIGLRYCYNLATGNSEFEENYLKIFHDQEYIKRYISVLLNKFREKLLFVYGPFIKRVTGTNTLNQIDLPHNSSYIYKLIGDCLGLMYENECITFDDGAPAVTKKLRELTRQEVLDIFFQYDSPEAEIKVVMEGINEMLSQTCRQNNWKFYNDLASLFQEVQIQFELDKDCLPILTEDGTVELMKILSFFIEQHVMSSPAQE